MATDASFAGQMRDDMFSQLAPDARELVGRIVATGAARGGVFAAGGVVRDAIIGRAIVDVDIVTEGDAIEIVAAAAPDADATAHDRFRTASLNVSGTRIDVATARRETYSRPGALPGVAPASIDADLRRRDFTMNAIALRLDGPPMLLDPCGGITDVDAKRIRVLHDASFADDATRIFRALRYGARLGFALEANTLRLLRAGASYIETIGGERVRRELALMLSEASAGAALEACEREGVLAATHPALAWDRRCSDAITGTTGALVARLPLGFALLAAHASPNEAEAIIARLKLTHDEATAVRGIAAMADVPTMLRRPQAKPSGVVVLLDRYPAASVAAIAGVATDEIVSHLALRYLEEWRYVQPMLRGGDIIELGVPTGPQVQRALQLVRAARLDGWAQDRGDEQALVLRFAKSIRDSGSESAMDVT